MLKSRYAARRRIFNLLLAIVAVELLLIIAAVSIRPALRALPGRYLVRLPEPVQRLAARPHAAELPTPEGPVEAIIPTFPVTPPTPTLTPIPPSRTPLAQPPTPDVEAEGEIEPSRTPSPTATLPVTPTPTEMMLPAEAARSTPADLERAAVTLDGITHAYQMWNNCGPATLSMALGYYGWEGDQKVAAAFLKPDQEDKNVNPSEIVDFVEQQGLRAIVRYGGDTNLIRQLLLAGFPVMVEKGFDPEPEELGWMGHYLLIIGYNEFEQSFVTMDSYLGPERQESYVDLDDFWRHFNRLYLVIYRPEQEDEVAAVLGDQFDASVNAWHALAINIAEVQENPDNAFAWFNLGSSYTQVGLFADAAGAYDQARLLGLPWRMLWYQFGPYEAYLNVGRYDDVLTLAAATLATTSDLEESFYYRGRAQEAQGNREAARASYQSAVDFNPNFVKAIQALASVAPQ